MGTPLRTFAAPRAPGERPRPLLDAVASSGHLAQLSLAQLEQVARELRAFYLSNSGT